MQPPKVDKHIEKGFEVGQRALSEADQKLNQAESLANQTVEHVDGFINKAAKHVENVLFSRRPLWLVILGILTVFFAWQATKIVPDASLQKMIPAKHEYVQNYLKYEYELMPLGNIVRIAVEAENGNIYSAEYINTLKEISEAVFFIKGVDRGNMRSLWTPNSLWFEAAEDGYRSGLVMPTGFTGTPEEIQLLRENILKAKLHGLLVSDDETSTVILAPLVEKDPDTGEKLEYGEFSRTIEAQVREKFENRGVNIYVVGFAKLIGDLIEGASAIGLFFVITVLITTALLYFYCRCWKSTLATIGCSLLAVVWHIGIMRLLGFGLDPYSILVPFMTFAIGVSHAVQNVNTMGTWMASGKDKVTSARATFSLLFVPGSIALISDAVGFSTLLLIDIGVIRELAISASVGIAVIIFTKMALLPMVMSYAGLSERGLRHAQSRMTGKHSFARRVASLADGKRSVVVLVLAAIIFGWGFVTSRDLEIGDLNPGAPEFRADARYNKDVAFFNSRFSTSSDVFVVIVTTPPAECGAYPAASTVRRLQWTLEQVEGVQGSTSLFNITDQITTGAAGGNLKFSTISRDKFISNAALRSAPQAFYNNDCSMVPVIFYLADHKAGTLDRVSAAVEEFKALEPDTSVEILLAAGNAGVEKATNDVVEAAWLPMLFIVYGVVSTLLMLEFRSIRITLCILIPLIITSFLAEAIMVMLGLGVKVATLPVIALGVGIGVDYGIYLYNRLEQFLAQGLSLKDAYFETMKTTGISVAFTGITLAAGVFMWIFSSIKFQADMGLLLAFMFLWNMVGAIILIPALANLFKLGNRRKPGEVEINPLRKSTAKEA